MLFFYNIEVEFYQGAVLQQWKHRYETILNEVHKIQSCCLYIGTHFKKRVILTVFYLMLPNIFWIQTFTSSNCFFLESYDFFVVLFCFVLLSWHCLFNTSNLGILTNYLFWYKNMTLLKLTNSIVTVLRKIFLFYWYSAKNYLLSFWYLMLFVRLSQLFAMNYD